MINPTEDFKQTPFAKGWLDVVDSAQFHVAAMTALAKMQTSFPAPTSPTDAQAQGYMNKGALMFLDLLMGLTKPLDDKAKKTDYNVIERTKV